MIKVVIACDGIIKKNESKLGASLYGSEDDKITGNILNGGCESLANSNKLSNYKQLNFIKGIQHKSIITLKIWFFESTKELGVGCAINKYDFDMFGENIKIYNVLFIMNKTFLRLLFMNNL